MKRVLVESPFAGDVGKNVIYARAAVRDCLLRGEAPFASHLLYTQPGIYDDNIPDERARGIKAGLVFGRSCDLTAIYIDRGISKGMIQGIREAKDRKSVV